MRSLFFILSAFYILNSALFASSNCKTIYSNLITVENVKAKRILNYVNNPMGLPPLNNMQPQDFLEAYKVLDKSFRVILDKILTNTRKPTFQNTIAPLEIEMRKMYDLETAFAHLSYMYMSKYEKASIELWNAVDELDSLYSRNKILYKKMKEIPTDKLTREQKIVVERYLEGFKKSGVSFSKVKKKELDQIEVQLTELTTKYSHNNKNANEQFRLYVKDELDLVGIPENVKKIMKEEAISENRKNEWVFSMRNPLVMMSVLKFSENRELRKNIIQETRKIATEGEFDNKQLVIDIVNLRHKKAKLLGYASWSEMALESRMANNVETVEKFYSDLIEQVKPIAKKEKEELEEFAAEKGHKGKLEPWDRYYYLEKMKEERFGIKSQEVREYFQLSHTMSGFFKVIREIFNIEIRPLNLKSYHEDVKVFTVIDHDEKRKIGTIFFDPYARQDKTDGAHHMKMRLNDQTRPSVGVVVTNFSRSEDGDALLDYRQVETLFHEFGHALHATLSKSKYLTTSSSSTPRDFVELQSQLLENLLGEEYVLKLIGKHYETGEEIPLSLITQLQKANNFRKATTVLGQIQMGMLDMALYKDVLNFSGDQLTEWEQQVLKDTFFTTPENPTSITASFDHVISGGYSSGYYGYLWAEILDKDAYAYLMKNATETGRPSPNKMKLLKRWVYADATLHPADEQYLRFKKGKELDPSHFAKTIEE